jgi:hypothetical protein
MMHFCGTNAHHQNGVAERAIQTISNMARAMILHANMHWKDGSYASLWTMAVNYAIHIYNNTPYKGVTPADIFTGSTVPRHHILDLHVWGCPVYVLDPQMQQGRKLPRWKPISGRVVNLDLIIQHSSEVPLVLNLTTGIIDTQYHVVFYDQFTNVSSIEREMYPPPHWGYLCLESAVIIVTDSPATYLKDDWLTEEEFEEKRRDLQMEKTIREYTLQRINPQPHEARLQREQSLQTELILETASVGSPHSVTFEPTIIQGRQEDSTPRMSNLNPLQPKVEPALTEGTTGLRRSTRLRKEPEFYMNGYLSTVVDTCKNDGY